MWYVIDQLNKFKIKSNKYKINFSKPSSFFQCISSRVECLFIQEYDCVHVYGKICNECLTIDYTCSTFSTLNQPSLSSPAQDQYASVSCCHTWFFRDALPLVETNIEPGSVLSEFINTKKIIHGVASTKSKVVLLKSKSNVEKYSVCGDGDVQFVTIFSVTKSTRKIFQCHSSICKLREGHSHSLLTLQSCRSLCQRLRTFQEFYIKMKSHLNGD